MSEAGKRLIKAAKEAIRAARCRHKWSTRIHPQQRWIACEICGVRKHIPEPRPSRPA